MERRPEKGIMLLPFVVFFFRGIRLLFDEYSIESKRAREFYSHKHSAISFVTFHFIFEYFEWCCVCWPFVLPQIASLSLTWSNDRLVLYDIIFCLHLHHYASEFGVFFSAAPEMAISQSTKERHQRDNELIASKSDETYTRTSLFFRSIFIVELRR